jgi:hypothetical protein
MTDPSAQLPRIYKDTPMTVSDPNGLTEAAIKNDEDAAGQEAISRNRSGLHGAHLRTLEALFRHPTAHNLEWMDAIALLRRIAVVRWKSGAKLDLELAGEHFLLQKAHSKELTSSDVVDLRHFLQRAGWSPEAPTHPATPRVSALVILMVVVDHHGAKIYRIQPGAGGISPRKIMPNDPHHFLHHLTHKDQLRESGQRAPEDPRFYERISETLAAASSILVVGHGKGKSNAARHLVQYLRIHHPERYQRVVRGAEADLSAITRPQLLALADQALGLSTGNLAVVTPSMHGSGASYPPGRRSEPAC